MEFFRSLSWIFVFSLLAGCGSTYNHETKQWGYNPECTSNRKDGRDPKCSDQEWNYVSNPSTQKKTMQITGRVFCGEEISEVPANVTRVDLVESDRGKINLKSQ